MAKNNDSTTKKSQKPGKPVEKRSDSTKSVSGSSLTHSKGMQCGKIPTKNGTKPPIRP